jgi:transposase
MKTRDARKLNPEAQEALRERVVAAVRGGMKKTEALKVFGISRTAIYNGLARFRKGGQRALRSRKRGRRKGIQLKPLQAARTVRMITDRCPDQLKMPFALWTREAVGQLIEEKFGITLSVWTVGRYLARWGLTPQKPLRRAFEKNPKAVRRWLEEEYPRIQRQAKRVGAEVHWGDEMGMRSDHQTGRSYGRKGRTPVIPGTGKRFSCHLISSITNRGTLRFMVFRGRFNTDVFLSFLRRLIRNVQRPIFLIVDSHPVHKAKKVERWLSRHVKQIRLFFLPTYSPELNPDEMLNNDVKSNAVGRRRARTQDEMAENVRAYLWSTQRRPDIVQSYFQAETVRYAAQ